MQSIKCVFVADPERKMIAHGKIFSVERMIGLTQTISFMTINKKMV